jgi:hypothetical protein
MAKRILVSDIGSTTTKLLLLEHSEGRFISLGTEAVGTTVEKPSEDVCLGFLEGAERLSRKTGVTLLDDSGMLSLPYFTTSSAGGGLQILVVALASSDSGVMANAVAYSSGGVVTDSFAIDDETPRVEKIRRMRHLAPDLVVMAGGYEDGAIAGVVNMAQLIAFACPKPKFGGDRLPLVFCGNTKARSYIQGMLEDSFSITFADNIRPDGLRFNLRPAVHEVHRLFMDHVMQMAPGYGRLSSMVSAPIIPTPAGVERILELYTAEIGGSVVMADIGGATTDIFSNVRGEFQRTVAANTGMSYSLSNILREAFPENVFRHIPTIDTETARNWVLGKTLFPTTLPGCSKTEAVEGAAAAEGIGMAWKHHLEMGYRRSKVGFTERLRRLGKCKFDAAFKTVHGDPFHISDIAVIIGAGGIMAHSSPERAAWILSSAFRPKGLTLLMVDRHFQSPHMGVLAGEYPSEALDYYRRECLVPVGRVYAPLMKKKAILVETPAGPVKVRSGSCLYLRDSRGVSIHGVSLPDDGIPLLVDMRFSDETIPMDFLTEPPLYTGSVEFPSARSVLPLDSIMQREFSLSYPGEIKVRTGDTVSPGDLLGENRLVPPRVYFVDVRQKVGYDKKGVTGKMVMEGISVVPGDRVSAGDRVASFKFGSGLAGNNFQVVSPVRGVVTAVSPPGMVIIQEIQDYDGKPYKVNVAEILGVKPRRVYSRMKVRPGDFVERSQVIAVGDKLKTVKSPATGTITEINSKTGFVTVQYVLEPLGMHTPVEGRVEAFNPSMSAVISFRGAMVPGIAGFGRLRWGKLSVEKPLPGSVMLLSGPLDGRMVAVARDAGVSGVVAPSVSAGCLVDFLGEEPGVIHTGDEDLPFSLIILRGVGGLEMEKEAYDALTEYEGLNCAMFTTTRLRAGVERPFVLLQRGS